MSSNAQQDLEASEESCKMENQGPPSDDVSPQQEENPPAAKRSEVRTRIISLIDPALLLMSLERGAIGWDSIDDPSNPRNWTPRRKWTSTALISLMALVTQLVTTIFAPAAQVMLTDFDNDNVTLGTLSVSIYLAGFAFGPLVMAPMSELFGRAPVLHIADVLFCILQVACARATNLNELLVFRLLAGIAGSAPLALGVGVIADLFPTKQRGLATAVFTGPVLLAPLAAPVVGGWIAQRLGWRWVFYIVAILGIVATTLLFTLLQETNASVLLERKTREWRKRFGRPELKSCYDDGTNALQQFKDAIVRPLKLLFLSPIVSLMSIHIAFLYGLCYLLYNVISMAFERQYGFTIGEAGLAYMGIAVGFLLGLMLASTPNDRIVERMTERNRGIFKPEFRLPLLWVAAFTMPVGMFWYGWTMQAGKHWILPIIGLAPFGFSLMLTVMPVTTYLIDAFERHAASALAANTVLRSLAAAFLPLAGPRLYAKLGQGWASSTLGFIAIAFIPIPIFFIYFGERIRTKYPVKL